MKFTVKFTDTEMHTHTQCLMKAVQSARLTILKSFITLCFLIHIVYPYLIRGSLS